MTDDCRKLVVVYILIQLITSLVKVRSTTSIAPIKSLTNNRPEVFRLGDFDALGSVPAAFHATNNWCFDHCNFTSEIQAQFSITAQNPSQQRDFQPADLRSVVNVELATSRTDQINENTTTHPVTALGLGTATTTAATSPPSHPQPQLQPQLRLQQPQSTYRRSFLETLLARQQNRDLYNRNQLGSSRVLNPINHVPRPTPIRIPPALEKTVKEEGVESKSLLTLPEQRRSRQNSPADPTVEQSPRLDPSSARSRSSIGLPSNRSRHSGQSMVAQDQYQGEDGGLQESDRIRTRGNGGHGTTIDLESQTASLQTGPFPGAAYGYNPADQPTQPPRRVSSIASLRRQRSLTSMPTDAAIAPTDRDTNLDPDIQPDESLAEELSWNPSHPCFPHPNPHVPLDSPFYEQTRIIRIKRDWMAQGDLAPAYSNIYPEILDPLMPENEFRFLINHVNRTLAEAFDPFSTWNWLDGFLGLVTGWLWEDFRPGGAKGKLKALEFWIDQWNQRVGSRDGVRVVPLRRTGYMSLDIEIPDPQVRVVDPNVEEHDTVGVMDEGPHNHLRMNEMKVGDLRRGTGTVTTDTESRV